MDESELRVMIAKQEMLERFLADRAEVSPRGKGRMDSENRVDAAYYATLFVVCAGLTAVLGYEIGLLAAHNWRLLVVAAMLAPWLIFFSWAVSDGE